MLLFSLRPKVQALAQRVARRCPPSLITPPHFAYAPTSSALPPPPRKKKPPSHACPFRKRCARPTADRCVSCPRRLHRLSAPAATKRRRVARAERDRNPKQTRPDQTRPASKPLSVVKSATLLGAAISRQHYSRERTTAQRKRRRTVTDALVHRHGHHRHGQASRPILHHQQPRRWRWRCWTTINND